MSYPKNKVPEYIYAEPEDLGSLFQGDIIEVTGLFRLRFKCYYPKINHEPYERKFAMVLSQSCDLARRPSQREAGKLGEPNLSHMVICLIRPLQSVLSRELEFSGAKKKSGFYLLSSPRYDATLSKTSRLINNSEAKNLFFLPKTKGLPEDSVALLNVSFSFRASCYQELLNHRVASLKGEFRAKVGFLLADYYGRVATSDLGEHNWTQKDLITYTKQVLKKAGVVDAANDSFIQKAKNFKSVDEIDAAVAAFLANEELKKYNEVIKESRKLASNDLFSLIGDKTEIVRLQGLSQIQLRKEISQRLKKVIPDL
ncbi:hypothetical protein B9G69_006760 [Bdellovibrio sp. SKB1291214]|uniref:hypothetical protein n=1 Tax=Bdellovibrio sp. SKB1291214 TaxID=1732569 RepID=UPI000B5165EF|nr:hypothetical protein [Bdellovibrio sp. SKB1291214]UYL10278.1 hypothetical protein B9G69_006760 [Bdellovibrio sp. SKB1291214]